MRAFIAIDLPETVRTALRQQQAELKELLAAANPTKPKQDSEIQWTNPAGIHLTLKFLGEINDAQVQQVNEALSGLEPFKEFSVEVRGFGFFPSAHRPRVLWAGIAAPPELALLEQRVEECMEKIGFEREQRDFNPHLTLARFKAPRPRPALNATVERHITLSLGSFAVSEFFLFESKLSPRGAEYRRIMSFPQEGVRLGVT